MPQQPLPPGERAPDTARIGGGAGSTTAELDADAARIRAAGGWMTVAGPGDLLRLRMEEPGWIACRELLTDLPGWQRRIADSLRRQYADVPDSVAPTYLMGFYLDAIARTGALWVTLAGRVPDLSPDSLWIRMSGTWPEATGIAATVVVESGDRSAVLRRYYDEVQTHAAEFQAVFDPGVRIGSRQRDGMLRDLVESSLWAAGDLARDPVTASLEAEALVGPNPSRMRRSCCFAYRLDDRLLCRRCPRQRATTG